MSSYGLQKTLRCQQLAGLSWKWAWMKEWTAKLFNKSKQSFRRKFGSMWTEKPSGSKKIKFYVNVTGKRQKSTSSKKMKLQVDLSWKRQKASGLKKVNLRVESAPICKFQENNRDKNRNRLAYNLVSDELSKKPCSGLHGGEHFQSIIFSNLSIIYNL